MWRYCIVSKFIQSSSFKIVAHKILTNVASTSYGCNDESPKGYRSHFPGIVSLFLYSAVKLTCCIFLRQN